MTRCKEACDGWENDCFRVGWILGFDAVGYGQDRVRAAGGAAASVGGGRAGLAGDAGPVGAAGCAAGPAAAPPLPTARPR
ncbi:hypothetical protein F1721_32810 [Saccharopolyspora hirsuta]|uniref:Uncharacterized protein n=1 Tax=Saccharopolyspora hirsuta TaxID=1837 RepID=A0A5M7B7R8_SACHI|nr:hypothetical protein F1721_32810 [Saccharopolyspora hirsuta]